MSATSDELSKHMIRLSDREFRVTTLEQAQEILAFSSCIRLRPETETGELLPTPWQMACVKSQDEHWDVCILGEVYPIVAKQTKSGYVRVMKVDLDS